MKILFDQGTPVPLRKFLPAHTVTTAYELGWDRLKNGELLKAAETAGYEIMITTDASLQYQQNLTERKIAIVVLRSTSWPKIQQKISEIVVAIESVSARGYIEVSI